MPKSKFKMLAIPVENWDELNSILERMGYKTGPGYGSQRGRAVVELFRLAEKYRPVVMSPDEYAALLREQGITAVRAAEQASQPGGEI